MARYVDAANQGRPAQKWGGVWNGVQDNVVKFRDELAQRFPQLRVTSAMRFGNGTGKAGEKSRHNRGQAMDLAADPEIGKFLYSAEGDALLRKYQLGFLDESLAHNLKATGGTGPHYHIGMDSTLKGNQYKGNTKYKRESADSLQTAQQSDPELEHDHEHDHEAEGSTTTGMYGPQVIVNQDNSALEYHQALLQEKMDREAQLQAQVEQEKAFAEQQNAMQEEIKAKMDKQVKLMEMLNSNTLEGVSRQRKAIAEFASGGEFQGLNDNLQYKIDAIKSQMPNYKSVDYTQSEAYRELEKVRGEISSLLSSIPSAGTSQVTVNAPVQANNTEKSSEETDSIEGMEAPQTFKAPEAPTMPGLDEIRRRFASVENSGKLDFSSKHANGPGSSAHGPYGWLNQKSHVQELWINNVGGLKNRYKTLDEFNRATWDDHEAKTYIEPLFVQWLQKMGGGNLDRMMAFNLAGYAGRDAYDRGNLNFRIGKNMTIGEYINKSKKYTAKS